MSHERRPTGSPARRDSRHLHRTLDRILDTPQIAQVVPRLPPELLHKLIKSHGLEDCGELLALATPEQLSRIIDLDVWRAAPGRDEQFDADRFGLWLEVLLESGASVAAQKLAAMDVDLMIAGLAQHARVFDRATVSPYETTDGEQVPAVPDLEGRLTCGLGGYVLVARRIGAVDSWDAIVAVLSALGSEHPPYFHQLMAGCRAVSHAGYEVDGLDDLLGAGDQVMFDLASGREKRREKQGYATPAQARAFLEMARELRLGLDTMPPENPIARAYFQALAEAPLADAAATPGLLTPGADAPAADDDSRAAAAVADVVEMLSGEIGAERPRALLGGSQDPPRLGHIQAHLQTLLESDYAAYSRRNEELAFLTNTLLAGCSIQARPFTPHEASDAAVAVCNLGLENWPRHWRPAASAGSSILSSLDFVAVFQVGWTVLHDDVSMFAAARLIEVLKAVRCDDRETQAGLRALRIAMTRHCRAGKPWRAREAMDVIAILDVPTWATLLALVDECPVIHAGLAAARGGTRSVDPSAFEFISTNVQIASVREFMESLPDALRA